MLNPASPVRRFCFSATLLVACTGGDPTDDTDNADNTGDTDPVVDTEVVTGFESISIWPFGGCARSFDDELTCWGSAGTAPTEPVTTYSAHEQSCAVTEAGDLTCWWHNVAPTLQTPAPDDTTFVQVSTWNRTGCGIDEAGAISCWGNDEEEGEAVFCDDTLADVPAGTFTSVSVGPSTICAVGDDASLACWGCDTAGQATPPSGVTFMSVSVGQLHACGVSTADDLRCWGIQDGGATDARQVTGMPDRGTFVSTSAGRQSSCALDNQGLPVCWGDTLQYGSPPPNKLVSVEDNSRGGCGIRFDNNEIACWGQRAYADDAPVTWWSPDDGDTDVDTDTDSDDASTDAPNNPY